MTRGRAKKHATSQQTAMGQEEEQRRVVIHYSASSSSTGEQCWSVNLRIRRCHACLSPLRVKDSHICAEKVQATTASEDPSVWQSQALKLKHPKTGIALSDLPYRF